MQLNPYSPGWYLWNLGNSYYAVKRYDRGLTLLKTFLRIHPDFMRPRRTLVAAYAQLGQIDKGRAAVDEILAHEPGASLVLEQKLVSQQHRETRDYEHWLEGLRKVGFPE